MVPTLLQSLSRFKQVTYKILSVIRESTLRNPFIGRIWHSKLQRAQSILRRNTCKNPAIKSLNKKVKNGFIITDLRYSILHDDDVMDMDFKEMSQEWMEEFHIVFVFLFKFIYFSFRSFYICDTSDKQRKKRKGNDYSVTWLFEFQTINHQNYFSARKLTWN